MIDRYNLRSDWYKKRLDDHGRDPCLSPYKWSQNEYLACLGREDVPLFRILDDATLPIIDPSVTVPTSLVQRAKCALDSINPATLHAGRSRTPRDAYFEKLARFLSARGPSVLADFMRVMVQTIRYRDLMGQYCLSMNLPEMSLLLRTEEVKAVTEAIAGLSLHASEWSSSDKDASLNLSKTAEGRAFSAVAPHLGASQFLRMFIERPKLGWDFTSLERGSLR